MVVRNMVMDPALCFLAVIHAAEIDWDVNPDHAWYTCGYEYASTVRISKETLDKSRHANGVEAEEGRYPEIGLKYSGG